MWLVRKAVDLPGSGSASRPPTEIGGERWVGACDDGFVSAAAYDSIGSGYATVRRTDPRIAAVVWEALADATSVLNVGAGTGSYEPADRSVIAVEPSDVMIAQRPDGSAPVVQAAAEALPIRAGAVDAVLAFLTLQHWRDFDRGLAELLRVTRQRVVVVTMDVNILNNLWLIQDYLPDALTAGGGGYPPLDQLLDLLPATTVTPIPVPADCVDGFASAFWARPEAYLDPRLRSGSSPWHQLPSATVHRALEQLQQDLRSGKWDSRHGALRLQSTRDVGLRLITADKG